MIDIIRIWFREEVRETIPRWGVFFLGVAFALTFSHAYSIWWWGSLMMSVSLAVWDLCLKKGEVQRRKEELYEYYRSQFETDKFEPVKLRPVTDEDYQSLKETFEQDRPRRVVGWVHKDGVMLCHYGGEKAVDCTHYECKPGALRHAAEGWDRPREVEPIEPIQLRNLPLPPMPPGGVSKPTVDKERPSE